MGIKKAAAIGCLGVSLLTGGELSAYQVMFETMTCNGETGFMSADIEAVYKIEPAACTGPDGKKLKKILLKNSAGSYDVVTLTEDSAREVMKDIKVYMRAKRKMLENGNSLVITR